MLVEKIEKERPTHTVCHCTKKKQSEAKKWENGSQKETNKKKRTPNEQKSRKDKGHEEKGNEGQKIKKPPKGKQKKRGEIEIQTMKKNNQPTDVHTFVAVVCVRALNELLDAIVQLRP